MATFYEVKQLLCSLLGQREVDDNDDDIIFEPRFYRNDQ